MRKDIRISIRYSLEHLKSFNIPSPPKFTAESVGCDIHFADLVEMEIYYGVLVNELMQCNDDLDRYSIIIAILTLCNQVVDQNARMKILLKDYVTGINDYINTYNDKKNYSDKISILERLQSQIKSAQELEVIDFNINSILKENSNMLYNTSLPFDSNFKSNEYNLELVKEELIFYFGVELAMLVLANNSFGTDN